VTQGVGVVSKMNLHWVLSLTADSGRVGVENWGGIRTLLMTILSEVWLYRVSPLSADELLWTELPRLLVLVDRRSFDP